MNTPDIIEETYRPLWDAEGRTLCVPCHRKTDTFSRKLHGETLAAKIAEYTSILNGV